MTRGGPLRIGLLGASRIAGAAVVAPARAVDGVVVHAIAARDRARAEEAARQHGIGVVHDSYAALLADDEIDAVYIASPAALHREQAVAALDAGHHVLVEKPLAANASDGQRIADAAAAAPTLVAMEAMHSRHHPVYDRLRALVADGVVGPLRSLEAGFTVPRARFAPDDIRWDLALGGGALMDLGVYPLTWLRHLLGDPLHVLAASAVGAPPEVGGDPAVDLTLDATLQSSDGVTAELTCSMDGDGSDAMSWLHVVGDTGRLTLSGAVAPQRGASLTLARDGIDGETALPVPAGDTYELQLSAFADAIRHGAPVLTSIDEGVATMELIDACYAAAGLPPRPARP